MYRKVVTFIILIYAYTKISPPHPDAHRQDGFPPAPALLKLISALAFGSGIFKRADAVRRADDVQIGRAHV